MNDNAAVRRRKRWISFALVVGGVVLILLDPENPLGPAWRFVCRAIAPAGVLIGVAGLIVPAVALDPATPIDGPDEPVPRPGRAAGVAGCLVLTAGLCAGLVWAIAG